MKRDSDSLDQALRFGLAIWAMIGGGLGVALGFFLAATRGWPALPTMLAGGVAGAALVYFGVAGAARSAGDAAAGLLVPSGRSTPSRAEYSHAGSLVARGRYAEAAAIYEQAARADPGAAEPCLQLGRLYRDRMEDPESAVRRFRQARDRARDPAFVYLITRELVEVLANRLGDPPRALPELARLAERHPDTPGGVWASAEIARLKARLTDGRDPRPDGSSAGEGGPPTRTRPG
jgi:tetratricopeptide (TPR) repeat protein